jgi:hypothetical protein
MPSAAEQDQPLALLAKQARQGNRKIKEKRALPTTHLELNYTLADLALLPREALQSARRKAQQPMTDSASFFRLFIQNIYSSQHRRSGKTSRC